MAFMPDYLKAYAAVLIVLGVISLLYGAFTALMQNDAKRIVAYSSLSHLGLIVIAIASFNRNRAAGRARLYRRAWAFLGGAVPDTGLRRRARRYAFARAAGRFGRANPRLAGALCIAALAALGLPGLAGFVGEIVILTGMFQAGSSGRLFSRSIPIVLASAYMLRLFQGIMNGPEVDDLPVRARS